MKKFFLSGALLLFFIHSYSQTLFTYGKNAVSKEEFLRAYNKNKTAATDRDQAIKDYLDLFIKFRLKVQAAKDIHLDTLSSMQSDLQNFRSQVEENYLKDDKAVEALVHEAFNRSQHDIHIQHLYVLINNKMPPKDTMALYNAINKAYSEVKNAGPDYEKTLPALKEKIAPVQANDLGMVTVFTLPYAYENIVYSLHKGKVSKPYRSKNGWHIFINEDEEHAKGSVKIAQILFGVQPGNEGMKVHAKELADSIYVQLKNGADFGEMAKTYSNDRATYMNKGLMPEFGVSKYDAVFEKQAFSLQHDSDLSKPFLTEFGYHIIKLISHTPVPENQTDETYMAEIKQTVMNDSRMNVAKEKFAKEVLLKTGYKKSTAYNEKDLWKITDTFAISNKKIKSGSVDESTVLFSFNNNEKIKAGDFMQYVRSAKNTYGAHAEQTDPEWLKSYVDVAAMNNYKSRLQEFNPEFQYQLEEFKEGNMLFEVMERKVWSKASADSEGLKQYYNEHKENYKWSESADAVLFSCANITAADKAMKEVKNGKAWKDVVSENESAIQADSARYELSQIPVAERTNFTNGLVTAPVVNSGDGTAIFALIIQRYPANEQRSFADARGLVINDYQNVLEKRWIDELEKKYPVKINETVLKSIL